LLALLFFYVLTMILLVPSSPNALPNIVSCVYVFLFVFHFVSEQRVTHVTKGPLLPHEWIPSITLYLNFCNNLPLFFFFAQTINTTNEVTIHNRNPKEKKVNMLPINNLLSKPIFLFTLQNKKTHVHNYQNPKSSMLKATNPTIGNIYI